jgi:hypothetical protein
MVPESSVSGSVTSFARVGAQATRPTANVAATRKYMESLLVDWKRRATVWGGLGWGFVPQGETWKEGKARSSFSEEKEAKRLLCLRHA